MSQTSLSSPIAIADHYGSQLCDPHPTVSHQRSDKDRDRVRINSQCSSVDLPNSEDKDENAFSRYLPYSLLQHIRTASSNAIAAQGVQVASIDTKWRHHEDRPPVGQGYIGSVQHYYRTEEVHPLVRDSGPGLVMQGNPVTLTLRRSTRTSMLPTKGESAMRCIDKHPTILRPPTRPS
ncbi:hypothetical protein PENSUB_4249 [Penicillium subrubescens]|uniref:Uncharacterized protein n=1 Tax=Penicillium subrubescens TaxID=1316194 RepID=A0A1Q5UCY6_9EURO|nr:hypothetical protein PENSUB_4249 [Penicillium subrubescens]